MQVEFKYIEELGLSWIFKRLYGSIPVSHVEIYFPKLQATFSAEQLYASSITYNTSSSETGTARYEQPLDREQQRWVSQKLTFLSENDEKELFEICKTLTNYPYNFCKNISISGLTPKINPLPPGFICSEIVMIALSKVSSLSAENFHLRNNRMSSMRPADVFRSVERLIQKFPDSKKNHEINTIIQEKYLKCNTKK